MADMLLELFGEHFRRQYLLYIIELLHGEDRYLYVGQTGDRRYTTARPAFRRLAAHFEDGSSTQNQVYSFIGDKILKLKRADNASAFTTGSKQAIEDYLASSKVRMYVYVLEPFPPAITHEEHAQKRSKVELFEKQVIGMFLRNKTVLMNKELNTASASSCPYPHALVKIKSDFDFSQKGASNVKR